MLIRLIYGPAEETDDIVLLITVLNGCCLLKHFYIVHMCDSRGIKHVIYFLTSQLNYAVRSFSLTFRDMYGFLL